jgi:hypothetical protein
VVSIYGTMRSQTMCFNVYIRASYLAEHGGYNQASDAVMYHVFSPVGSFDESEQTLEQI